MPRSGPGRRNRLALDMDAALLDRQEAAEQIEQRRLAAAGRTEQGQEFPRLDIDRNILERQHWPAARRAIEMMHIPDDDLRLGHGPQPLPWSRLLFVLRKLTEPPRQCTRRKALP